MIPKDLQFDYLTAFWLIFACILFAVLFFALFNYRKKMLHLFALKENLPKLLIARSSYTYFFKSLLFCLIWVLAVFALAQPFGNGFYPEKNEGSQSQDKLKAHEIVFLLDASASMGALNSSSSKTRLDLSKEIADEILSDLKGESASLYAFTSVTTKLSPATLDLFFVRMMLRDLSINEGAVPGTDFLKVFQQVREKLFSKHLEKLTTLIILSDGGDTALESLQGESQKKRAEMIASVFEDAKDLNLRIFTIGIGSENEALIPNVSYLGKPVYSKLQSDLLKLISEKARGKYYESSKFSVIDIAKNILKEMSQDDPFLKDITKSNPQDLLSYQLFFQIPLGFLLLFLTIYIFFPETTLFSKKGPFVLVFLFLQCQGFSSPADDLKVAQNFMQANEPSKSHEYYQKLLDEPLKPFEKAVVLYNQGTVFLSEDRLSEAIDTFESIYLSGNPPPFLTYRIKKNLSIAQFRKALSILSDKNFQDLDESTLEKLIYLLRASKKQSLNAIKFNCDLQKIEGLENCTTPNNLNALLNAIEEKLTEANSHLKQPLLNETSSDLFQKKILELYEKGSNLKPSDIKSLKNVLEIAVLMESETLKFTRFLNESDEPENASLQILQDAQNKTLTIANAFLKASFNIQLENYEKQICQKKPWIEILPLYHKGYSEAINALNLMPQNLEKSALKQEEAIKYWKLALNVSLDKQNEDQIKQDDETKTNEKDISEKALQLLQEMQAGDKKQKAYPKTLNQEVEKPW